MIIIYQSLTENWSVTHDDKYNLISQITIIFFYFTGFPAIHPHDIFLYSLCKHLITVTLRSVVIINASKHGIGVDYSAQLQISRLLFIPLLLMPMHVKCTAQVVIKTKLLYQIKIIYWILMLKYVVFVCSFHSLSVNKIMEGIRINNYLNRMYLWHR